MRSSAEPARHAGNPPVGDPPTGPGHHNDDRVVPISRHSNRTGRGRRTPQPAQPDPVVTPPSPEQRLALDVEAWFLAHKATLTDETAAHVYRTTLDFFQVMLRSSHAEERLNADEYQHLTSMMRVLRDAPDTL
ncbi:hypothetical protein [Streptomyces parvus]|uniref:Uncharacterized protein n=1 Tax=Streptomyces parvus TaxID=66428 RepID=A0A7K3RRT4_9ACTN|nr:hypothetical protein [Streptomyces parvus]NEC17898.1 hypothetical protein [Streptomyces parvus]